MAGPRSAPKATSGAARPAPSVSGPYYPYPCEDDWLCNDGVDIVLGPISIGPDRRTRWARWTWRYRPAPLFLHPRPAPQLTDYDPLASGFRCKRIRGRVTAPIPEIHQRLTDPLQIGLNLRVGVEVVLYVVGDRAPGLPLRPVKNAFTSGWANK